MLCKIPSRVTAYRDTHAIFFSFQTGSHYTCSYAAFSCLHVMI